MRNTQRFIFFAIGAKPEMKHSQVKSQNGERILKLINLPRWRLALTGNAGDRKCIGRVASKAPQATWRFSLG
jgi:hypothetical protein